MIEFIFYGESNQLLPMQQTYLKEFHFSQLKAVLPTSYPITHSTLVFHLLKLLQFKEGIKSKLLWDQMEFYKAHLFIIFLLIKITQFIVISKILHYQAVSNVITLGLLLWLHTDILFLERLFSISEQLLPFQTLVTFQFSQSSMMLQAVLFQSLCTLH